MRKEIVEIQKLKDGKWTKTTDEVATEIRFDVKVWGKESLSIRCTPENLEELVIGLLFSKGYIDSAEQVERVEVAFDKFEIQVVLNGKKLPVKEENTEKAEGFDPAALSELFRTADEIFEHPGDLFADTGCAHSCTLAIDGRTLCTFEDVGRHNALDKVIGRGLKMKADFSKAVIYTSGRISGDYLQKIIRAGIPTVVSRAAVTGEAVKLAKENNIRMYGFVRSGNGNCYNE